MIALLYETWVALTKGLTSGDRAAFLVLMYGLWFLWLYVFISTRFYKPWKTSYNQPVSVIVPVYHEKWQVFVRAMTAILTSSQPIREVIVVTDEREPDMISTVRQFWQGDNRVRVFQAPPGKRAAIRMGIEEAKADVVVVIESDTFAINRNSIAELVRPFGADDLNIGGVVGNQLIYEPRTFTEVLNNWTEALKYAFIIPFQSQMGCVTVLGGRCVAYLRSAVLPLMDGLTTERFLGVQCVAGDDGRVTSLLLATGWKTVFQSSAEFRTISPEDYFGLLKQRLRWFRNSCRRTLRAMFMVPERNVRNADRFWVYKHPRALYQMLRTWLGSVIMGMLWYLFVKSIWMGYYFHWFGSTTVWDIVLRILVISILGAVLTRVIKAYPIFKTGSGWWILALPLFPFHMAVAMVLTRILAIFTMWKSGWISRQSTGAGGFNS